MPDPEELLRDPDQAPLPLKPSILYAVCSALAAHATPEQGEAMIRIARRLQAEACDDFGALLVVGFLRAHPEARTRPVLQEFLSSELGQQSRRSCKRSLIFSIPGRHWLGPGSLLEQTPVLPKSLQTARLHSDSEPVVRSPTNLQSCRALVTACSLNWPAPLSAPRRAVWLWMRR